MFPFIKLLPGHVVPSIRRQGLRSLPFWIPVMVHGTHRIPSNLVFGLTARWKHAASMPVLILDPTRSIGISIVVAWVLSTCYSPPCEIGP